MTRFLTAAILLVICGGATAQAQSEASGGSPYYPTPVAPMTGLLGQYGPSYDHASTWQEGVLRGHADVIRSWGQYNYLSQLGAVYGETANRMAVDNREHAIDAYFNRRDQYTETRTAELAKRREKTNEYLQNARRAPMSVSLFDGSGHVAFPAALRGEELGQYRAHVEQFLLTRGSTGQMSLAERQQLAEMNDALLRNLQSRVREIPGQEYAAAKTFLTEVARQLRTA